MSNIATVDFHGDAIVAVEQDDGVFVAIKTISDALELRWSGQRDRLHRDTILSEGSRVIRLPSAGGPQETLCLKLELVNGWLFTIDDSRVKDEAIRQKVLTYKRECYAVMFRHFYGRASAVAATGKPHSGDAVPLDEIRTWLGVVDLARRLRGAAAACVMWERSPLPPLPEPSEVHAGAAGDVLEDFLAACCRVTGRSADITSARALWIAYNVWTRHEGVTPVSVALFGRRLCDVPGVIRRKSGTIRYAGILLHGVEDGLAA